MITGRGSAALQRRAQELKIEFVYEHQAHKIAAYEDILKKTGAKNPPWLTLAMTCRISPLCGA